MVKEHILSVYCLKWILESRRDALEARRCKPQETLMVGAESGRKSQTAAGISM